MKLKGFFALIVAAAMMVGCGDAPADESGEAGGKLSAPSGLAVVDGSLTTDSATLMWGEVDNAKSYKYKVTSGGSLVTSGEVSEAQVALSGLEKKTEYAVQVMALAEAPYENSMWSKVMNFTTLLRNPSDAVAVDAIVAKDGSGDYLSVQAAIDGVPDNNAKTYIIYIKEGVYEEELSIAKNKDHIVLVGDGADKTILSHDGYQGNGEDIYCTLYIGGKYITLMDLTVRNTHQNNTGNGDQAQAVQVHYGDYVAFFDCNILGYQDTFWGRSSESRVYVKDCLVEGNVDFIYGGSVMLFDGCHINVNRNKAAITAPSTPVTNPYGIVFMDCDVTSDAKGFDGAAISTIYLGRAWQNAAKCVWLRCKMPATLSPEGWMANMNDNVVEAEKIFAEWGCTYTGGATSDLSARKNGGRALTDEEAASYTLENIFAGVEELEKFTTKPFVKLN